MTLADLQFAAADVLSPNGNLLGDVVTDFQLRWAEILQHGEEIPVTVARRLADALFPTGGGRTWAAARVHSPDLMLRAGGEARWVLGELHLALNTLESRVFRTQADDPDELVRAVAADMPAGRVVPLYPADAPEVSSRTYPPLSLDPPGHYRYLSYGSDDGHSSGAVGTPATALLVEERDGELVACAPAHGWEAPVLECFGEFMTALVVNLFQPRAPVRHGSRATIGDLVVCRRSWRLPVAELGPIAYRDDDAGHDRLRQWARDNGLPRHVFARTAAEAKPFYVDFDAPALVDNMARAANKVVALPADKAHIELVEMLPAPDELWLTGSDGESYTAELRVVVVDPVDPSPPSWPMPMPEPTDA
ncbi:hypothetical protein [Kibdelosporangium aridum]|uniref:hypothetical protein n=1 Tax=Kibdelosporangium aridum TaxID=2030 RepID=UPI0035E9034D